MESISVMDQVLIGNVDLIGPKSLPNKKLSLSCPLILLMELLGSLFGSSISLRVPYAVRFSRLAFGVFAFWCGLEKKTYEERRLHLFFDGILYEIVLFFFSFFLFYSKMFLE